MNPIAALARLLLKLTLLAAAIVFALSLLCVALLSLAWVLLKALLTGRKPAFVTTFQHFRQATGQFRRSGTAASASAGDVMDVQAREVSGDAQLPFDASHDKL